MKLKTLAPFAVLVALVAAGCGGSSDTNNAAPAAAGKQTLSLVAYSTPEVVYDQLTPLFQKTTAGSGIGFKSSYGASGDQSRAVAAGQKADVVNFSLAPDMTRLVTAGLVAPTWNQTPTKGFVSTSVVTFIVRKGNPKHIKTWADLLRPGVQVITPNPFSSGAAKWNLLAAYGYGGLPYVRSLISQHVKVQPTSGRAALQTFTQGTGDVVLSYENEAITAQKKGESVDYVVPAKTIKIEMPIAVTKNASPAAKAFVDFALSNAGQQVFATWGYRPVDAAVLKANAARFPTPAGLFTIASLGGWTKVNKTLFDPTSGAFAKIEQSAGVSTAK